MAPKKKTRIPAKSKRAAAKKATPKKKLTKPQPTKKSSQKSAAKKRTPNKAIAKKKIEVKKAKSGTKIAGKTKRAAGNNKTKRRNVQKKTGAESTAFLRSGTRSSSGGQAGDLQGLSHRESVDSESVDELLEEGNAFEAGVVMGVEDARDADEGEVRTHEVSEDDVPEEYLDDKE
jgi:hypothetical protein